MENMEINNTEVNEMEVKGSGKGLIIAAVVGAAILVGGIVYKKVVVPYVAKRKAKKEAEAAVSEQPTVENTNV